MLADAGVIPFSKLLKNEFKQFLYCSLKIQILAYRHCASIMT